MKIAVIGYGKMGKTVERIATERGHAVSIITSLVDSSQLPVDVSCAIEFTHAGVASMIVRKCIDAGIPVVSGTTGWDDERLKVNQYCLQHYGSFVWAANFSVGMHIVFELNKALAVLMNPRTEYDVEILETHHTEKKDAPSGTAKVLASQILDSLPRKTSWELSPTSTDKEILAITAERLPEVKGIHRITYSGPHDIIALRHEALSRDAFALGAVLSAEWLVGKQGVFSFNDVMTGPK